MTRAGVTPLREAPRQGVEIYKLLVFTKGHVPCNKTEPGVTKTMNVVSLKKYRELQGQMVEARVYRARIEALPKVELLEELLKYHGDFLKDSRDLQATLRGQQLMDVLEARAELSELRELSQDFRRKLQRRLALQLAPAGDKQ